MGRKFKVRDVVRVKKNARKGWRQDTAQSFRNARWYGQILRVWAGSLSFPLDVYAGKRGQGRKAMFAARELYLVERPKPKKKAK